MHVPRDYPCNNNARNNSHQTLNYFIYTSVDIISNTYHPNFVIIPIGRRYVGINAKITKLSNFCIYFNKDSYT